MFLLVALARPRNGQIIAIRISHESLVSGCGDQHLNAFAHGLALLAQFFVTSSHLMTSARRFNYPDQIRSAGTATFEYVRRQKAWISAD